jgi:hypothetical protein
LTENFSSKSKQKRVLKAKIFNKKTFWLQARKWATDMVGSGAKPFQHTVATLFIE